jgi:hypothetical protein
MLAYFSSDRQGYYGQFQQNPPFYESLRRQLAKRFYRTESLLPENHSESLHQWIQEHSWRIREHNSAKQAHVTTDHRFTWARLSEAALLLLFSTRYVYRTHHVELRTQSNSPCHSPSNLVLTEVHHRVISVVEQKIIGAHMILIIYRYLFRKN